MRGARVETPLLATAPAILLVGLVIVLPQLLLLWYSFKTYDPARLMVDVFTLDNYAKALADPFYLEVLGRTLGVSAVSVAICLVLGFPLAYTISRAASQRAKMLLFLAVVLPLLVGNAARTIGWMVLLGDAGAINRALMGIGLLQQPLQLMYTDTGVILALVSILLPFVVITLQSVVDGISPALEEAAAGLGAGALVMAWRILLPLAMPGIFAGAILSFVLGIGAYATPVFIGGPAFQMMAPKIYEQIVRVNNWPMGAALSFILLTTTIVITLAVILLIQRRYGRV
jgi:putative spermidine/putrescine transport system permease protein